MRLSICIPTYNRATDVSHTVRDIAQQCPADVEIVVSNNGSNDDTIAQLARVATDYPQLALRVINQSSNIGFDRNVLAVVAAAEGEYCWLLSDDDGILPGGVAALLDRIQQQPAATYLLNYQRYDAVQQTVTAERMISLTNDLRSTDPNEFYFQPTPLPSYFQILGTNMITMSVDVFQRLLWNQLVPQVQPYVGKNFIHIFILTTIMWEARSSAYLAEPWVRYVSNHHRSWDNDIWTDYKTVFLPYLKRLGYTNSLVDQVTASTINYQSWLDRLRQRFGHLRGQH